MGRRQGRNPQQVMNGSKIRYLRKSAGLSGDAFATRVGISKSYLSKIERNVVGSVSLDIITALCTVLNVTPQEITLEGVSLMSVSPDLGELYRQGYSQGYADGFVAGRFAARKWIIELLGGTLDDITPPSS